MSVLYYLGLSGAGYLALTLFLYALSIGIPAAGFFARLLAAYVALVLAAMYGVFVSIALRPFGYHRISQWTVARAFKWLMYFFTGTRFKVIDPGNYLNTVRPAVLISNHQTELDVDMLGWVSPKYCSVTAKKSLKKIPILGWFMTLSGSVFLDRANSVNARHALDGAAKEITKERQNVYMFPEGTRSYSKEPMLLPFKKGAFHLAVQAGVPIIPVVVANYSNVLYAKDWKFNKGEILVKVLKPIETKHLDRSDVEALTRDTRDLMLKELVSLTAQQRGQPIAIPATQNGGNGVVKASGVEATLS